MPGPARRTRTVTGHRIGSTPRGVAGLWEVQACGAADGTAASCKFISEVQESVLTKLPYFDSCRPAEASHRTVTLVTSSTVLLDRVSRAPPGLPRLRGGGRIGWQWVHGWPPDGRAGQLLLM
eukprot:29518-Hanusia_phi.AAC.1